MLESERLYLRRFEDKDLEFFYSYRNDPECGKYQSWDDNSKLALQKLIDINKTSDLFKNGTIQVPIVLKNYDQMIGHIFLAIHQKTLTIGYTLAKQYWHQGYAREIVAKLCESFLEDFPDHEIIALIKAENIRSLKLVESLGFEYEGKVSAMNSVVYVKKKQN